MNESILKKYSKSKWNMLGETIDHPKENYSRKERMDDRRHSRDDEKATPNNKKGRERIANIDI